MLQEPVTDEHRWPWNYHLCRICCARHCLFYRCRVVAELISTLTHVKTATFFHRHHRKETGIFTRRHNLKPSMTAPFQVVTSRYQAPLCLLRNSNFVFLPSARFKNAVIHPRRTSSSPLRYALHTQPVSPSGYYKAAPVWTSTILSLHPCYFYTCFLLRISQPEPTSSSSSPGSVLPTHRRYISPGQEWLATAIPKTMLAAATHSALPSGLPKHLQIRWSQRIWNFTPLLISQQNTLSVYPVSVFRQPFQLCSQLSPWEEAIEARKLSQPCQLRCEGTSHPVEWRSRSHHDFTVSYTLEIILTQAWTAVLAFCRCSRPVSFYLSFTQIRHSCWTPLTTWSH